MTRGCVLCQHLPQSVEQRPLLGFENVEVCQNTLERLLDAEHGFVVVSVAVFVEDHLCSLRWSRRYS